MWFHPLKLDFGIVMAAMMALLSWKTFWKQSLMSKSSNFYRPLSKGLDILQGEDNCFFGTHLPTLETIIKKVVALQPDLSSMTIGLTGAVEDATKAT